MNKKQISEDSTTIYYETKLKKPLLIIFATYAAVSLIPSIAYALLIMSGLLIIILEEGIAAKKEEQRIVQEYLSQEDDEQ